MIAFQLTVILFNFVLLLMALPTSESAVGSRQKEEVLEGTFLIFITEHLLKHLPL